MLKRKKILSKLLATTMVLTSFTVNASAAEVNSDTILGGSNRFETAIKISENGWSTSDRAVLINGEKGLVDALTATPYAYTKNAPILITVSGKLTPATANRLTKMGVKNVDVVGGTNSVSEGVVTELKNKGITVNRISGASRYDTSLAVAKEIDKIQDVAQIAVVNGDKGIPDAVSVAAPAASKKMPILLAENNGLNAASKKFVDGEGVTKSYVIGSTNSVSDGVMNSLPGTKTRLGGANRHDTNAAVIKEFYTATSLSNIYVAKSGMVKSKDEIVDALSAGVLAAKNGNPIVLVGNNLETSQQSLLASKKFTKMTQIGMGIPTNSVTQIKATQADAEASATSVSVVDYKTIKIKGSNLNLIDKTKVSLAGNTVSSYTVNSGGTEATIVFNNGFSGTNTVKVTSNLGKVMELSFTYDTNITSVEAPTKEIGKEGIQYLKLTVNGNQQKSIEELKSLGWTVEFKSKDKIFYGENGEASKNSETSSDGKLRTSETKKETPFTVGDLFSYEVTIKNGSKTFTSGKGYFEVVDKSNLYNDITSVKLQEGALKLNSTNLVVNKKATIVDVLAKDSANNEVKVPDELVNGGDAKTKFTVTSDDSKIISVDKSGDTKNQLTANDVGSANITISNGSASKTIRVTVNKDEREPYRLDIASTDSTQYIINGKKKTIVAKLVDKYGDPINKTFITESESKDIKNGDLILAKISQVASSTNTGEIKFEIEAQNLENPTNASYTIKEGDKTWGTIYVHTKPVPVDTTKLTHSLEIIKDFNKTSQSTQSDDTSLDVYSGAKDQFAVMNLNKLDGNYFYEKANEGDIKTNYTVESTNDNVAKASIEANGSIKVTAISDKASSATINIKNKKGEVVDSKSFTVKDTTPKITKLNAKSVDAIKYEVGSSQPKYDVMNKLFNITKVGNDYQVDGLTISGTSGIVTYKKETNVTDGVVGKFMIGNDLTLATVQVKTDFGGTINPDGVSIPTGNKIDSGNIIVSVYNGNSVSGAPIDRAIGIEVNVTK